MPSAPGGNSRDMACMASRCAVAWPSVGGPRKAEKGSGTQGCSWSSHRGCALRLRLRALRSSPPPRREPLPPESSPLPRSSQAGGLLPAPLPLRPPSWKTSTEAHCCRRSSFISSSMASQTLGRARTMAWLVPMSRTIWCPSKISLSTKTLAPVLSRRALILAPREPMSAPVLGAGSAARKVYSPGSLPSMLSDSSTRLPLPPPRSRCSTSTLPTSTTLVMICSSASMMLLASPAVATSTRQWVSG
mmetsp:Transcript_79564/g.247105  ORF Transcript_79564/g.247105 Transcript_79564/m.247105 type:complete len:246 (+) Transcript_79564:421-1158(+)